MIILIVFIVVLETGQFHVVLPFYVSKAKLCRLKLAAKKNSKNTEKRAGLRFDRIHEKVNVIFCGAKEPMCVTHLLVYLTEHIRLSCTHLLLIHCSTFQCHST